MSLCLEHYVTSLNNKPNTEPLSSHLNKLTFVLVTKLLNTFFRKTKKREVRVQSSTGIRRVGESKAVLN